MSARYYRTTHTFRQWKDHPGSPFATSTMWHTDPSAAHEYCLRLQAAGHHNIVTTPTDSGPPREESKRVG